MGSPEAETTIADILRSPSALRQAGNCSPYEGLYKHSFFPVRFQPCMFANFKSFWTERGGVTKTQNKPLACSSLGLCMWFWQPVTIRRMALEWRYVSVCGSPAFPRVHPWLCTFLCLLCSRRNFLSRAAQGRLGVDPQPWRKSHSEKRLRFYSAGGCCPWHHLHSPTLWPRCVLPPLHDLLCVNMRVVCKPEILFFFLAPAPPKLCNLEVLISPPPARRLPALPLFGPPTLPLTEHCVQHWRAFCLQGLLTHPRDHLE